MCNLRNFALVIFCVLSQFVFSSNQQEDKKSIDGLLLLSDSNVYVDFNQSLKYAEKALRLSKKNNDS